MGLVVGLGNPGPTYVGTRHNIGFEVVDHLAAAHRFDAPKAFKNAVICRGKMADRDLLLVKPQTYMNLSGDAVGAIARFYKLAAADIVVAHDELDFLPGEVRLKVGGGHGGHNGLRSLIAHIGADFVRVRLGVGKPPKAGTGADWVLGRFDSEDRIFADRAVGAAAEAIATIWQLGPSAAMNRFNQR